MFSICLSVCFSVQVQRNRHPAIDVARVLLITPILLFHIHFRENQLIKEKNSSYHVFIDVLIFEKTLFLSVL